MIYLLLLINAYLRTWRDIFKILFKHNRFGVRTDKVNFKPSNLRGVGQGEGNKSSLQLSWRHNINSNKNVTI